MSALRLWLCAGALLFLPSLNARNVKLVPTETKTVTTNGATHEISRYRVVPDNTAKEGNNDATASNKNMRLKIAAKSTIINDSNNSESSDSNLSLKVKPKTGNAESTNFKVSDTTIKPEDTLKSPGVKYHVLVGSQSDEENKKGDANKLESMSLLKHNDNRPNLNVVPLNYQNINGRTSSYSKPASDALKLHYPLKALVGRAPIANRPDIPRAELYESDESDEELDSPGDHNEFGHFETKSFKTVYNPTKVTNTVYTEMPWKDGIYTEKHDANSPYFMNQYGINQTFALPGKRGLFKIVHIDGHNPVLEKPTFEHSTSNPMSTEYVADLSRSSNDNTIDPRHESLHNIKSTKNSNTVPIMKHTNVVTKMVNSGNGAKGLTLRRTNSVENLVTHINSVKTNHNIEDTKSAYSSPATDNKAVTIIFGVNNGEHTSDKADTNMNSENTEPTKKYTITKTVTRETIKEPINISENSNTNNTSSTETTHNIKVTKYVTTSPAKVTQYVAMSPATVTKYVTTSPASLNMKALQTLENPNVGGFTYKINSQDSQIANPETKPMDVGKLKEVLKENKNEASSSPENKIETEETHHLTVSKTVTKSTKKESSKDNQIVVTSVQGDEQTSLDEAKVIGRSVPQNIMYSAPKQDSDDVAVTKSVKINNNDHDAESAHKNIVTNVLIENDNTNKHVLPVPNTNFIEVAELSSDKTDNSNVNHEMTTLIPKITKLNDKPLAGESKSITPIITKNVNKTVTSDSSSILNVSVLKNKNKYVDSKPNTNKTKTTVRTNSENKSPSKDENIVRISLLKNDDKIYVPVSRTQINNINYSEVVTDREIKNVTPNVDRIINISFPVNERRVIPKLNLQLKTKPIGNQPDKANSTDIQNANTPLNDDEVGLNVLGNNNENITKEDLPKNNKENVPTVSQAYKITVHARKHSIDDDVSGDKKVIDISIVETNNAQPSSRMGAQFNDIYIIPTEKPHTRTSIVTENDNTKESEFKENTPNIIINTDNGKPKIVNRNYQLPTEHTSIITTLPKIHDVPLLQNDTNSGAETNAEIKQTPTKTVLNNILLEPASPMPIMNDKTKITNAIQIAKGEINLDLSLNRLNKNTELDNNNNNKLAFTTTGLKVTPFYSNPLKPISESDEDYKSSEKVLRSGWRDSVVSDEDPYPFDDGSRSSRITYREQITDSEAAETDKNTDQLNQYVLPQNTYNPSIRANAYFNVAPNAYNNLLNPYKTGCSGNANFPNMQGFQNLYAIDEQALQYILNYLIANNILTDLKAQYAVVGQGVDLSAIRLACLTRYLQNIGVYHRLTQPQLMYLIEQIRQRESVTVQKNKDHKIEIIYENDDSPNTVPQPIPGFVPNQYIRNPGYVYNPYNVNALRMNQNYRLLQDYAYLQQFLLEGFDENTEYYVAVTDLCKRVLYLIAHLRKCGIPDASIMQFIYEVKNYLRTEVLETLVTECSTKAHLSIAQRIDLVAKQCLQNHLYKINPYQYYGNVSNPQKYYDNLYQYY